MNILDRIAYEKIIPVIKLDDAADVEPLLTALKKGGITVAEITFRTEAGESAIRTAAEMFPDVLVGAGTVINLDQAKRALAAGAKFIVSPGFSTEVAAFCLDMGVPYLGGCVTPTEIMTAISYGSKIIKFFPAENYGGVATLKALAAAFPQVKFMPTGGINKNNIKDYLAFDKVIACGGSWMVKDKLIKEKAFDEITRLAAEVTEAIR